MVVYKLQYFRSQGRAEAIRLAFKLAGVDYEEVTIQHEDWPQRKQELPTQRLPVLEVDGKMIGESKTVLRYVSREFGFYGKTSLDSAHVDQVIDMAEDIWVPVNPLIVGTKEEKLAKIKKYLENDVPPVYASLERLLSQEYAGDFFVGDSITAADLFVFTATDLVRNLSFGAPDILANFPKLKAVKDRVAANPNIAAWLEVRPSEATV